jgi:hypothetical protein
MLALDKIECGSANQIWPDLERVDETFSNARCLFRNQFGIAFVLAVSDVMKIFLFILFFFSVQPIIKLQRWRRNGKMSQKLEMTLFSNMKSK